MTITLTTQEKSDAIALTEKSLAEFAKYHGHYPNKTGTHVVGKLGEIAAERWLKERIKNQPKTIMPFFRDEAVLSSWGDCDIVAKNEESNKHLKIEVKTWRKVFWQKYGRCVAEKQIGNVLAKGGLILWVVVDGVPQLETLEEMKNALEKATVEADVLGFNKVSDFQNVLPVATGPTHNRIINRQIKSEDVRGCAFLVEWLAK